MNGKAFFINETLPLIIRGTEPLEQKKIFYGMRSLTAGIQYKFLKHFALSHEIAIDILRQKNFLIKDKAIIGQPDNPNAIPRGILQPIFGNAIPIIGGKFTYGLDKWKIFNISHYFHFRNQSRLTPFIGASLSLNWIKIHYQDEIDNNILGSNLNDSIRYYRFGFSPIIGLSYQYSKKIFIRFSYRKDFLTPIRYTFLTRNFAGGGILKQTLEFKPRYGYYSLGIFINK